jgi:lipopolysaccharide assembly outer membrane protein LptD (OstA)
MKFLISVSSLVILFTIPQKAIPQNGAPVHLKVGAMDMQALSIERLVKFPGIVHLKGSVEIATKVGVNDAPVSLMIMVVRADEADYHEDTGEIEARGNVQMNYRDDPSGTRAGNVRIRLEKINSK